ncbi:Glycine/D-amino acid oxidase [Cohaesibacter marisflavi]|uniref:Glycine/D-amino acid oxidase n=1 Tax=Cohaesibacter marisflavi TaxID=655353 RepID=A0A1I5L8C1_9HYPH|nr:FAD-binding oxidoreductase [Cohaesibacter marisflavi]SFO93475.1 Glycine/D-amino acid oxidase [Cohaesibacter marisflavi]
MPVPLLERITPQTHQPQSADVVIIGAGIAGTSAALFFAEAGLKVVVCEKGLVGAEQSSRNWGWVRQMGRDAAELPLTMRSLSLWRKLDETYGIETGFRETGITYVARTRAEEKELTDWSKIGQAANLNSRVLAPKELEELLPGIAPRFRMGLYTADDGRAEPGKAAPAIAGAAQKLGATFLEHCAVRGIETEAGKLSAIVTEHGPIKTPTAILAAGAWSRLFLGNLGLNFPQLKVLGTAARVEGVSDVPTMAVGGGDFAFRETVDGAHFVALRNYNIAPLTPDHFRLFFDYLPVLMKSWRELNVRLTKMFFSELRVPRTWSLNEETPFEKVRILDPAPHMPFNIRALKTLKTAFPKFVSAHITHNWAGIIDTTPDAVPAIGPIEQIPGLHIASGFSGHGFGIGPGAGELIAEIVRGVKPAVDPKPFRFDRFGKTQSPKLS